MVDRRTAIATCPTSSQLGVELFQNPRRDLADRLVERVYAKYPSRVVSSS
jgi:hypothetical protein